MLIPKTNRGIVLENKCPKLPCIKGDVNTPINPEISPGLFPYFTKLRLKSVSEIISIHKIKINPIGIYKLLINFFFSSTIVAF